MEHLKARFQLLTFYELIKLNLFQTTSSYSNGCNKNTNDEFFSRLWIPIQSGDGSKNRSAYD